MEDSQENPIFELSGVSYRYDDIAAVNDLSLRIERGRRIALLGANGSGKSTLLRLLDGLYFPQKGTIEAFGEPLTEESLLDEDLAFRFRQRVALVFQNPDVQLFNPTVFDEVAFGPLQLRWDRDTIIRRVAETLEDLEIAHLKDRSPHRLSGGEKKRVAIASVMILEPEVLLMDEPTAALDPKSRGHVIDILANAAGTGKTVITATHDLDIIEDIAEYCVVLQNGTVVKQGPPQEILSDVELLESTGLVHAHRHHHGDGKMHSHPHLHRFHEHGHGHEDHE